MTESVDAYLNTSQGKNAEKGPCEATNIAKRSYKTMQENLTLYILYQ